MIAAGLSADADRAAAELRDALNRAGLCLPGLRLDARLWDTYGTGPVRLLELGCLETDMARRLSAVIRKGATTG